MSAWTQERRAAQSARLRERKPWLLSTGPRTVEGKKRSSLNGCRQRETACSGEPREAPAANCFPKMLYFAPHTFSDLNAAMKEGKIKTATVTDADSEIDHRARGWKDLAELLA